MTSTLTSKTWICLCRPSDIRNVAGALRAVANFGLAGVKLITDDTDLSQADPLRAFSSRAYDVVKFEVYSEVEVALRDASVIIGTSRRPRAHQHLTELVSAELCQAIEAQTSPHILFGNERVGLSHAELDHCHGLVTLPSQPSFPSLNLAHAVACVAYELAREGESQTGAQERDAPALTTPLLPSTPTNVVVEEAFLRRTIEVSQRVGYPPGRSSERFARQLRSLLRRAQASEGDYGLLLGILRELDRLKKLNEPP